MNPSGGVNIDFAHLRKNLFRIGWERGAFSDVKISAFGQEYSAHRIILSQSPYFETILQGEWSESNSKTISLSFDDPHIQPDSFRCALEFLYGQTIVINQENVHGTLAVGCFLGLEPLCERCLIFVAENLNLQTFEGIYLFGNRFDYGVYSRKIKELCLDFLRMHACWEARGILRDLDFKDIQELLMDDVLWVPTEVERFLMLQDTIHLESEENESPMSCCVQLDETFHSFEDAENRAFCAILANIRFEHFPEMTLKLLKEERRHVRMVHEAIENGIQTQEELKKRILNSLPHSFGSKLTRHFRVFSKSDLVKELKDFTHRSFRVGIEFMELVNVYKTKGLDSPEYFYGGSLWRVHMVQRRVQIDGMEYIGVFIYRRSASGARWADHRDCVDASLRVRMGWGDNKVDKTCYGKFNSDSWNSYGWPQFIRKSNFEKCRQLDGSLRLTLNITLQL